MKYLGNKAKLITWIFSILDLEGIDLKNKIIFDGFLGTGAFSKKAMKREPKKIYACELLKSMCFYSTYNILGIDKKSFEKVRLSFLETNVAAGYFSKNFSTKSGRNYFSNDNALKIDSMLHSWDKFNDKEKGLAIDMIDRVSNTSGTYGSFLKIWRPMALKKIEDYKYLNNDIKKNKIRIINESVNYFNKKIDIAYFDHPYNTRQYGAYYHVLERVVDKKKRSSKKTGVLLSDLNSIFCRKHAHIMEIKKLIDEIKADIIIVSYNNEGLISQDQWEQLLKNYKYKKFEIKYKRFKTNSNTSLTTKRGAALVEQLFLIRKIKT